MPTYSKCSTDQRISVVWMSQFELRRVKRCIKRGAKRRQLRWRYNKQRYVLEENGLFCDPQIVKNVLKEEYLLTKTSSGWFLNKFSRFKYVYIRKIRYGWQFLGKFRPVNIHLYERVGITILFFLSNQKFSLCHGINCGWNISSNIPAAITSRDHYLPWLLL